MSGRSILGGVVGLQLAALAAAFVAWTLADFSGAGKQAETDAESSALLLAEHVERSLDAIDTVLLQTEELVHEVGLAALRSEPAGRRLRSLARPLPPTGAIFIYDLRGDPVAASTPEPFPAHNVADREFHRILVAGREDCWIGKALQGRSVHRLFFPVARAIRDGEGRVVAVAQVGVEVDYLSDLFRRIRLGEDRILGIYRISDGAVVARFPMEEELLDESIGSSRLLAAVSGGESPAWTGWEPVDGIEHVRSARRVGRLPLVGVASMSRDRAFAGPLRRLLWRSVGLLAVAGALATLGGMLLVSQKRQRRIREDRRRAEDALRESESLFRIMFVESCVGKVQCDPATGRFLRVNPTFCQLTGRSEEELLRSRFLDVTHPDDRPSGGAKFAAMVAGEIPSFQSEKRYLRPDGSVVWGYVSVNLVREPSGKPLYAMAVIQDITARKRAEEELKAAKAGADDARTAAESANRAKDQFIAVLSHELRTPLTPALAAAGTLLGDPGLSGDQRQDLELIHRNIELEVQLIDDLLDINRIVAGKLHFDRRPVDLVPVVREAAAHVAGDIEAASQDLRLGLPREPRIVEGDPARLQQVFWNLLRNATKFTPRGGSITFTWETVGDGDSRHVAVSIADTGRGIPPELLPRLFRPFEQGEAATNRQFGGLGLGLVICRAVVELHGGTIRAESAGPGRGTTFRVTLPLVEAAVAGSEGPGGESPSLPPPAPAPSCRPLRILLVEDHPDTARITSRLLSAKGHEVITAGSVDEALEQAAGTFDVMVSDLGLPDGTGYDLLGKLRSRGRCPRSIALSGFGSSEDIRRCIEAGFVAHLTKPVRFETLLRAIRSAAEGEDGG